MPTPPWGQGLRQLPLSPELRIQLHLPKAPSTAQGTRAATPCPAPSTQGAVVPHFAHVLSCFPSPASTPQPLTWRGENQPTEERLRWCLFQLKAGSLQVTPGIKPPCLAPIQDPVGEYLLPQHSPHHFTGQVSTKSLPSSVSEHGYTWGLTPACPPVWCLSSNRSWITGRHRPKAGFSRAPFLGEAVPVSRAAHTAHSPPPGWLGAQPQLLTHRQSITVTREQLTGRCHSP